MPPRTRHPWSRRPEPFAVAEALCRGIRDGLFAQRDIATVTREAACTTRHYFAGLARRGYHVPEEELGLGYGPAAELFTQYPECPFLRRYLGELILENDPDPMHVVRKFRRVVQSYAYNWFLAYLGFLDPVARIIRRQIRDAAQVFELLLARQRLVFVSSRREEDPISSWEHISELGRLVPSGASVLDLVEATQKILLARTAVGGWMTISDLVSDYQLFYLAHFTHQVRDIATDDPDAELRMRELRDYWLRIHDLLRKSFLDEWEGPADVAERDFQTFCDFMSQVFETGWKQDRWLFWRDAFPDEIHTSEEFRDSRHRRRADAVWKELRSRFLDRYGSELYPEPKTGNRRELGEEES